MARSGAAAPVLGCLIVLGIAMLAAAQTIPEKHQVRIPGMGNLKGFPCDTYTNVTTYLGVPYAYPPWGQRRFAPPMMWDQPYPFPYRAADTPPKKCPQPRQSQYDKIAEDCLYLNIYTPFNASINSIAVRVIFHGGWFHSGSASDPYLNGCKSVAETNTTLVVVQYRLGPFGFLSHPSTLGESQTTGNWGMMDQQLALQWISENIKFFGGNSSVMIMGQNAGGISVALHNIMPASTGLFTAALSSNGAAVELNSANDAYDQTDNLANALGCPTNPQDQLACMRNQTWQKLLAAVPPVKEIYRPLAKLFWPVVDGFTIPQQPLDIINNGNFATMPYMLGVNQDEGRTFFYNSFPNVTALNETQTEIFLQNVYPGVEPQQILQQYWIKNYNNAFEQMSDIWTDIFISCPTYKTLTAVASYVFPPLKDCKPPFLRDRSAPCIVPVNMFYYSGQPVCPPEKRFLGASSKRELVFLLSLGNPQTGCALNRTETDLAYDTTYALGTMAKFQQPAFANYTPWALWTPQGQTAMVLDGAVGLRYSTIDYASRCAVYDNLVLPPIQSPTIQRLPPGAGPVLPGYPLGVNGALPSPPPPVPKSAARVVVSMVFVSAVAFIIFTSGMVL